MRDPEIRQLRVADLKPYYNNPRHNENAVDAVAASIKAFGFRVPIVVDGDYTIITGHTRLLAAKKLGLEEVPCIIADDLTPEQVKAFRLADNKTAEIAVWDEQLLAEELAALESVWDMTQFGFLDREAVDALPINEGEEIDIGGFDDEAFEYVCKRCGFRFDA